MNGRPFSPVYFSPRLWYNEMKNSHGVDLMNFDNTYVKIDLDRIAENFEAVRQKAGVPVMAIVKADA